MPLSRMLARCATSPIRRWVLDAFPRGQSGVDYDQPAGDVGLFGPDSVTWRIHADFPGMLAGGLSSLMLQALHPRVLAGVYDHSNFRHDLVGRLRRTTAFVAGTTYAATDQARHLIERVRRIHHQVRGTTADGLAYAADDPDLLTWVHVTEAHGFLQGYRHYCQAVPEALADRYYDEGRRVAQALGARQVPASQAQVQAYFEAMQPQLRFDARSREVMAVLARIRLPVPLAGLSRDLFLGAAAALLPDWAPPLLALGRADRARAAVSSAALRTMAPLFRMALTDGVCARACARIPVPLEQLHRWPTQAEVPSAFTAPG